tara:strand:+ start:3540 stop:4856 length:1317 start_codon:yes stop_codon:yes gene_type:complete
MASDVIELPIERVHLFENNPRHGYIADPDKIIERLLEEEQVYELAKSIAEKGTNPLQLIGVIRIDDEDDEGEPTYIAYEGNRRVCAIMLLNDPDLAPAKWHKRFQKLSADTDEIETIDGRVFEDKDVLKFWMANIHNRNQKGRGRREWGPDEQHRFNPTKKYAIAFDLLEIAEAGGLITPGERRNRLTTLQRFVGTDALKTILKADDSNPRPGKVKFGRSKADLEKLLKQLIADLLGEEEITSRKNDKEIQDYAGTLEERAGVKPVEEAEEDDETGDDEDTDDEDSGGEEDDEEDDDDAPPPKKPHRIKSDKDLKKAIAKSKNDKLIDLYKSVTTVSARANPQLIAVGCWSLIETIAAVCKAKDKQAFADFFNRDMLQNKLGFSKTASGSIVKALGHMAQAGNTTKHDAIGATFDAMQLINDMDRVSPMLAKALATLP